MDSCGWNVQHIDILQKTWSGQLDCTPGVVVLPRWPCAAGSEEFRTQDGYDTLMPIPPLRSAVSVWRAVEGLILSRRMCLLRIQP